MSDNKREYNVCIPITGIIWVTVEADSKEAAIEAAFDSEELTLDNLEEWEAHKQIVQGNILHASQNQAFAEEA